MFIESINITKFRAVENLKFDFKHDINAFGGENGIGKTSMLDAILWMLSDETIVCGKDNTKNLDDNDKTKPIIVELSFLKDEGRLELKREYKANYKDGEFKDYSNLFWINDAKYSGTDYFKRLRKEFHLEDAPDVKGFNIFRALIDFDYFGTLDYKIAREVIESILHLDSAEDILGKDIYTAIRSDLIGQNYDIAKLKTTYNTQEKAKEFDIEKSTTTINTLKANFKPIDKEKLSQLENAYLKLKDDEYEHSAEYKSAYQTLQEKSNKVSQLSTELNKLKNDYNILDAKNNNIIKPLEVKENQVELLRKEFVRVKNSVSVCPNCKYELNKDDIAKELREISAKGKQLNAEIEELKKQFKTEELKQLKSAYDLKQIEYNDAVKDYEKCNADFSKIIENEDNEQRVFYQEKQNKLTEISSEIASMKSASNQSAIDDATKVLSAQKEELAKIQIKKELVVDFEKEKIQAIQEKVDDVFPGIEFVLTEISDRGAEKKTCRPTYKGVDYQRLNDGQRIQLGFDIIKCLNNVLGIEDRLPVMFDKLRDLSKDNINLLKSNNDNIQIFTTFVSSESQIQIYNL